MRTMCIYSNFLTLGVEGMPGWGSHGPPLQLHLSPGKELGAEKFRQKYELANR